MPHDIEPPVRDEQGSFLRVSPFDRIKRTDEQGEFWSGRDLQKTLGFTNWRKFETAVNRSRKSCENTGLKILDHFDPGVKMVDIGSGAQREVDDWRLTRYACYLVAMNSDPNKPEVAAAQQYFVTRTRESEVRQERQLTYRERRMERLRDMGRSEEFIRRRDNGVVIRKEFTGTLKKHGCDSDGIRIISGKGNQILTGQFAYELRRSRDIPKNGDVRDFMDDIELSMFQLSEAMAKKKVVKQQGDGNEECIDLSVDAYRQVRGAFDNYFVKGDSDAR